MRICMTIPWYSELLLPYTYTLSIELNVTIIVKNITELMITNNFLQIYYGKCLVRISVAQYIFKIYINNIAKLLNQIPNINDPTQYFHSLKDNLYMYKQSTISYISSYRKHGQTITLP